LQQQQQQQHVAYPHPHSPHHSPSPPASSSLHTISPGEVAPREHSSAYRLGLPTSFPSNYIFSSSRDSESPALLQQQQQQQEHNAPPLHAVPTRSADGQYASALNIGGAGGLQSGPRMPNCMATPSSNLQETSCSTLRSRFISKLPSKRSMRAPRMRWNSRLHQHFVHAVELLGGHESNALSLSPLPTHHACFCVFFFAPAIHQEMLLWAFRCHCHHGLNHLSLCFLRIINLQWESFYVLLPCLASPSRFFSTVEVAGGKP
jgi:hypothetical protein